MDVPQQPTSTKKASFLAALPNSTPNTTQRKSALTCVNQRSRTCLLSIAVIIIVLGVVGGIGGYCGAGNCGGDGGDSTLNNNSKDQPINDGSNKHNSTTAPSTAISTTVAPTNQPSPVPTSSPTTTASAQLTIACNFLGYFNLIECQSNTVFDGAIFWNTIPAEIGLLTQLNHLDLSVFGLNGTIPATLGNLTQLTSLSLNSNQLDGTIPSTLGFLTLLTHLSLWDNRLSGTIPSNFGQMTQLDELSLYANTQLIGTIPSTLCPESGINIYIDCDNIECLCCLDPDSDLSCS